VRRLSQTRQFSRDVKRITKRGKDIAKLKEVVTRLAEGIPPKFVAEFQERIL